MSDSVNREVSEQPSAGKCMARIARKVHRLLNGRTAATKCLLLVAIVCVIKVVFLLPIIFFITRSSRYHHSFHTNVIANGAGSSADVIDFPRRPSPRMLQRVLQELNVTASEVPHHLPLTLQGRWLLNNASICGSSRTDPVDLLFLVHTAPDNYHRRLLMRNTIASEKYFHPFQVRAVFLLGRVTNSSVQEAMEMEHAVYGDTVQGDFLDSYRNLSHKGVMGFRWVTQHCPQVRYVVKMDDDVFFDTYKMLLRYRTVFQGRTRSIFCNLLLRNSMPIYRDKQHKWAVEGRHFAGKATFPYDYCSGLAVVLTGDLVPALFQAAFYAPVFWIDDVYLFGLLPALLGDVTMLHLGYKNRYVDMNSTSAVGCMKQKAYRCSVLATTCYTTEEWENMWNLTYHLHLDTEWRLPYVKLPHVN